MNRVRSFLSHLRTDERGAHIVEFGLIALPLTVVLLVFTDFGYRLYLGAVVEGALHQTARFATVGGRGSNEIDEYLKSQLVAFSSDVKVSIDKRSYSQFSGVGKDEKFIDSNANGRYDSGVDCYYDDNGNRVWDTAATSGRTGTGGSDDLIYYTVTANFPRVVPLGRFLGWSANESVSSNMVLRNQPFGSQAFPECTR